LETDARTLFSGTAEVPLGLLPAVFSGGVVFERCSLKNNSGRGLNYAEQIVQDWQNCGHHPIR
jgi:hypothetical protein